MPRRHCLRDDKNRGTTRFILYSGNAPGNEYRSCPLNARRTGELTALSAHRLQSDLQMFSSAVSHRPAALWKTIASYSLFLSLFRSTLLYY